MKKRIFVKITAFVLLMTMLFSINVFADGYSYGYYVDNVEYIGNGEVEATIVFAANTYGSGVDVNGVGVLAVYDETQSKICGMSTVTYNEASPFLSNQRFSVTQTAMLEDLTLERYIVKFILLGSFEDMAPAAYVSTGTNAWVLEGDDIIDEPADNPPSSGGSGGGSSTGGGGVSGDIEEDFTDLVIEPELFNDFTLQAGSYSLYNPNIRYYVDADAETPNTASVIEAPFEVYMNKGLTYSSGDSATASDVAEVLNGIIGSGAVNKITTNNRAYRFKDTDNNGYYDKLIIENSASFVAGKIIADDYQIYRDNSTSVYNSSLLFDGYTNYNFAPLELDTSTGMVSYTICDTYGNDLSLNDIEAGDVLNVAMSVDGNKYHYDIVVSTAKIVTGTIMRVASKKVKGTSSTIDYYTIDGNEYRINGTAAASKLGAGVSGTFYLTNNNAIIRADIDKNYSYGIVIATGAKTGTFENGVQTQIMSMNGEVMTLDFAENVEFNASGMNIASNVDYDSDATNGFTMNPAFAISAGTIVIYETNSAGEIKKIYTTQAAIEAKENSDVKVDTVSATYDIDSAKISGKYMTDETVIIGVPTAALVGNKDKYIVASADALDETSTYNATLVYDTATKEVKYAFITNLLIKPAYNSTPMVVTERATVYFEEELRSEFTGLIDGKEVRYVLENTEDLTIFGMTGDVVAGINTKDKVAAFDIGVNDVIQVVTNANDEIIAYRHLMKYDYSEGYIAMVASAGNEDSDTATTAVLTKLSDGTASLHNSAVTNKQMYGYATAGRVNKVTSRGIELFKDPTITSSIANLTAASNIIDAAYDTNIPAYIYGGTYSKVKTSVFESIKTFDTVSSGVDANLAADLAKADDVVYIYSFDGENVLNFIVDVASNN